MKKLFSTLFSFLILINFSPAAYAYNGDTSAEAVILYQPDTNSVLYGKNIHESHLIASTTKIMTALVVLENAAAYEIVEILPDYTGIEGSSMYLKAGERFTVKELLYGLLLISGNDAAVALANHVSGSVEDFAVLMNEKAKEIGCMNTHFTNPHGLDDEEHYSSAFDLALIMKAAMEDETFVEITSTKSIQIADRAMTNHNKLLWNCEGCIGGKTGYTENAGRTLVSVCERDNMELICVTISDRNDWEDHKSLYDWGYDEFCITDLSEEFSIPVISGDKDVVTAVCVSSKILTEESESLQISFFLPEFVYAPIYAGEKIGSVVISTDNNSVEYFITATEAVMTDESVPLSFWEQIKWSWYYYNGHSGYIPFIPRF